MGTQKNVVPSTETTLGPNAITSFIKLNSLIIHVSMGIGSSEGLRSADIPLSANLPLPLLVDRSGVEGLKFLRKNLCSQEEHNDLETRDDFQIELFIG